MTRRTPRSLYTRMTPVGFVLSALPARKGCLKRRSNVQSVQYGRTAPFKRPNTKWVGVYGVDMANRRNVLIGLGGLVAGGGALIGTGAFDTVEAERTVNVETAGDGAALLGIAANPDYDDEIITDADAGGTLEIDIGGATTADGGEGINQNARTVISDLVDLTNQGTQDVVSIEFEVDGDNGEEDVLSVVREEGEPSSSAALEPGQTYSFGFEIDLLDDGPAAVEDGDIVDGDFEPTLTITAESEE